MIPQRFLLFIFFILSLPGMNAKVNCTLNFDKKRACPAYFFNLVAN
jgi:hypothetical protein